MYPTGLQLELRSNGAPIAELGCRNPCRGQFRPADGESTRREARPRQEPATSQFGHAGKLDDQRGRATSGRLNQSRIARPYATIRYTWKHSAYSRFTLTPWTRARFQTYSGSA
jgi:hypothetical protein